MGLPAYLMHNDMRKHPYLAKSACSHCTAIWSEHLTLYSVTGLACTANCRRPTIIISTALSITVQAGEREPFGPEPR